MSKVDKIIRLIHLLTNRPSVTLDTIMAQCDIPERTAYRYLNTISEANIPVYYDKEVHAYRLNDKRAFGINNLPLGDAMTIALALRLLAARVNNEYGKEIETLVSQFLVRQYFALDEVMDTFDDAIQRLQPESDCSELLSAMLLHIAMRCEKQVLLTTGNGSPTTTKEVRVDQPRLKFKESWLVVESARLENDGTSLSDVRKVSIQ